MARLLVVLSVCIVAASAIPRLQNRLPGRIFGGEDAKPAAVPKQDRRLSGKIVGGEDALPGEVPWQALVAVWEVDGYYSLYCDGSILSPIWVISSASCTLDRIPAGSNLTIFAGVINIEVWNDGEQEQGVAEVIYHPNYDSNTLANDIALMRLQSPLDLNSYVFPIPLPSSSYQASGNAQISGFGQSEDNSYSAILQKATIPIMSDGQCNTLLGTSFNVTNTMLCAGRTDGGVGVCEFEWGGPLVCGSFLCGVFITGFGCGEPNTAYVFTEVSYFVNWINQVTGITQ